MTLAAKKPAPAIALTHADLVRRAAAWLRAKGCGIVFTELVSLQSETPDAIGWRDSGGSSYLIECKASRGDFLADKRKHFRQAGSALGVYRYYMCPPGMIRVDEVPERWGLLYCHPKKVELARGRDPTRWDQENTQSFANEAHRAGELRMMYSALNRLKIDMGEAAFHTRVHLPYVKRQKERLSAAGAEAPHGSKRPEKLAVPAGEVFLL